MNREQTYEELVQRPIPLDLPSVAGWKEIPIRKNGERLVPLGPFSKNDQIFTRSIYAGEGNESPYRDHPLVGSLLTMFVREGVALQLKIAQGLLPRGMYFVVFDAYRTLEVQRSLFDKYFNDLKDQHTDWAEETLLTETQKYVSLPSHDQTRPSPHNTGGSVDLAIFELPKNIVEEINELNLEIKRIDLQFWRKRRLLTKYPLEMKKMALIRENAQMLNFGTPFDWGGPEAGLNYLEKLSQERELTSEEQIARGNRRILYQAMTKVGMEPYEDEWWHYNTRESQMGARTAKLSLAKYGATGLSAKNMEHERMRQDHRRGTIRLSGDLGNKLGFFPTSEVLGVAYQAAQETGDIRITSLPNAAVIAPIKP